MFAWFRDRLGWPARPRVRIADVGPEARALRRLIKRWLADGPDLGPALRLGRVEIVVLHHVRLFGDSGPVVAALTERTGSLTRIAVGRFYPGGSVWQPYSPAELLTSLDLHLDALARGYAPALRWFPGADTLVTAAPARPSHPPALGTPPLPPAAPPSTSTGHVVASADHPVDAPAVETAGGAGAGGNGTVPSPDGPPADGMLWPLTPEPTAAAAAAGTDHA